MKVQAIQTISGTYGFLATDEVMDMNDDKAQELIKLNLVKEFKGTIAAADVKVAVDKQNPKSTISIKEVPSQEEPSKAIETDPANATEEKKKAEKNTVITKELKTATTNKTADAGKGN